MAGFLGTLATAGVVGLVAVVVLRLVVPERLEDLREALSVAWLGFGALVAVVATAGSLWFSEVANFPPCKLCWYQRIAMYPLMVLLGLGALRRDRSVRLYGIVVASIGLAVSAWHNVIETFPTVSTGSCDPANPCTIRWVEGLGFWTIPRMAALSFVLILTVLTLDRPPRAETS